jgi:precorrin-8X/cobalt-precorrin-8 methylmutase
MEKGIKIEKESFDIIEQNVDLTKFSESEKKVLKRAIHASGDFEFVKLLKFSENWEIDFKNIVLKQPAVICDVNMVKSGITDKYLSVSSLKTYCFINNENIIQEAKKINKTRAEYSMEYAYSKFDNMIFVIGNAPTALLKILELYKTYPEKDIFVIGVPVGFVKADESKEILINTNIPHISNIGTKGGSGIAASIFNALIKVVYKI